MKVTICTVADGESIYEVDIDSITYKEIKSWGFSHLKVLVAKHKRMGNIIFNPKNIEAIIFKEESK
jgi:hypothetical protein